MAALESLRRASLVGRVGEAITTIYKN
jgi:hypothetical protein